MGKTSTAYAPPSPTGKHPHLRGENPYSGTFIPTLWETSPPAWGKLRERVLDSITAGNIPTCVGKTLVAFSRLSCLSKHPHLRGENSSAISRKIGVAETSPPAWGKPHSNSGFVHCFGNIPTCVGKTTAQSNLVPLDKETSPPAWGKQRDQALGKPAARKHPHLRGENETKRLPKWLDWETSPPAWGKPGSRRGAYLLVQKHPHLRGENKTIAENGMPKMETSPPAWGKQQDFVLTAILDTTFC